MRYLHLSCLSLLLFNLSCSSSDGPDMETVTKIEYHFQDASVAPEYQRNYGIAISAQSIHLTVDSYGNTLNDKTFPFDESRFQSLKDQFDKNKIKSCEKQSENLMCTGGTADNITCYNGEEEIFSGSLHHCGDFDEGTMCGNVENYVSTIKKLIPDLAGELK